MFKTCNCVLLSLLLFNSIISFYLIFSADIRASDNPISDIHILLNNFIVGTYYNILSNILYYYDTPAEYHAHTNTTTQALITVMPMGRFFILY